MSIRDMRLLLSGLVLAGAGAVGAAEYTLTVDSGEQSLDAAMAAAYPGSALAAGDTVVKKGAGTLKDSSAALALADKLRFEICAGALLECVKRIGSTYCVSNGATVEVSVDLKDIATSGKSARFELSGSGTADRPGALYLNAASSQSSQYIVYTLKSDATIYCNGRTVNIASTGAGTTNCNIFNMNGHALCFKQTSPDYYFRFRNAVTFNKPGVITFDTCGVTRSSGGSVFVDDGSIPCVRLVNGTKFNCVNDTLSSKIAVLDCEAGTTIGKVNDAPSDYTLTCLKGCPTITADQKVTVKSHVARASDLLAGRKLTSAGSFGFAEPSDIWVDGCGDLTVGTDYQLIETATAITGAVPTRGLKDVAAVRSTSTQVWFKPTAGLADYFTVFVPVGVTESYVNVTKGRSTEDLQGKTLMKLGGGKLTYGTAITNSEGKTELKGTLVKNGMVNVSVSGGVPIADDGKKKITVEDGATLQMSVSLFNLTSDKNPAEFTLCGGGYGGLGALRFEVDGGSGEQRVTYDLTGDATIVSTVSCTLSSCYNSDKSANIFRMNGHDLTFRGNGADKYFRFRYGVSFRNPGTITFQKTGVTHLPGAGVYVTDAKGNDSKLPLVKLVENASANFADSKFADAVGVVDCEPGTKLCGIRTDTDAPQDITLACIRGCPEISNERVVTIGKYIAKAVDIMAGKKMVAKGTLTFASDATVGIDTLEDLTIPDEGYVLAQGVQGVAGLPKRDASVGRNRVRVAAVDGVDSLLLLPGEGLLLFVR